MASRLMRRSGIAVGLVAELLGWRPDVIYQVGVGLYHEEVKVLSEEWPETEWVGFEPHPGIAAKLGDYPGVVYQMAVGDRMGATDLWCKSSHKDGSSLFRFEDQECESVSVLVTTLDEYIETLIRYDYTGEIGQRRGLLWLDCEGSELAVLRGAARRFLAGIEMVNVELTAKPPGVGWCKPEDVHEFLLGGGFWLQWLHTQRSCSGQVDAIYVRKHLFRPEYCCVPQERIRWNEEVVQ